MSDAIEAALLPCPWCGGAAREQENGRTPSLYREVVCDACDFCGPSHDTRAEAIAAWNRRPAITAYEAAKGGGVGVKPVAWRVKDYADGWIFYTDEKRARVEAKIMNGALVEPLYSADAITSPASGERDAVTQAAADVLAERKRQVEAEGWMPGHDDGHTSGELAQAAAAYAYYCTEADNSQPPAESIFPTTWDESWWKPSDHRRNLVKAGALILAEIERLDRAALRMEGK